MRVKRLFLPLLSFALLLLFVGSGFGFFYFGANRQTEADQQLTLRAEDSVTLGTIALAETAYEYQLFMDAETVYLFRTDNPTVDADISLIYRVASEAVIPDGYQLALSCDIILSDPDERGVKQGIVAESGNAYDYSDSILDYFAPTSAVLGWRMRSDFVLLEGDKSTKEMTYRCVLLEGLNGTPGQQQTTSDFRLHFAYLDYDRHEGGSTYHGSMAPGSQYQALSDYAPVMTAARNAQSNAQMSIVFRLTLEKEG